MTRRLLLAVMVGVLLLVAAIAMAAMVHQITSGDLGPPLGVPY